DSARDELSLAAVLEQPHLLVILRHKGSNVQLAIAVEVANGDVRGSLGGEEQVIAEAAAAAILQPQDFAVVIPEHGPSDVEVAVPVQVADLHVRDPANILEQDMIDKLAIPLVFQPHDLPNALVGRIDIAENRDDEVQIPVAIEIDRHSSRGVVDL